ncbi:benzoate/H(+) symporter BenE family transporter [Undibacterium sp.]|uniref:benzoate/H(+) symporter BenE family transporter n=1 Tax=Undibacterium sp. TaxID=1914977 RepID=UPI0025E15FAC|nr:benzoate/H(+) symporter BenE family transporter [Undibacterium sp.]
MTTSKPIPLSQPASTLADSSLLSRISWRQAHDVFPAVLAGFIAVLISYAGPMLLILQAGQAARLSQAQMASWVWAISIGAGVCCICLSWRHKIPVICAWNTPGAALLVGALASVPYNQAIGAYLFAAAAMWLVGVSGVFERLMAVIPKSLCAAMLAGILFKFGVEVFAGARSSVAGAPLLVAAMFVGYLLFKRSSARYAIVLTLLLGISLWLGLGWGDTASAVSSAATGVSSKLMHFSLTRPVWTTPEFSVSAIISIGLPLALLCLTGQQVPGVAVLRAANYNAPVSKLVGSTGLASLITAPFGSHGINLAAITAAICTGPEAHQQPEKRWLAGLACGAFYLLIGSFAGSLTDSFMHLPPALVGTVAGLALLGAIQNGLVNAMQEASEREAALLTFIVTASNVTVLGLGSACWGIGIGLLSYVVLRPKAS